MPSPARLYHTQQVHYVRRAVAFNTPGVAAGVEIGTLPAGSRILDIGVYIDTAFNAATTNVLNAGTTPTGVDVVTTAVAIPGTAGFKRVTVGNALASLAADTTLYASYTQTGTAATAGAGEIVIAYVPPAPLNA